MWCNFETFNNYPNLFHLTLKSASTFQKATKTFKMKRLSQNHAFLFLFPPNLTVSTVIDTVQNMKSSITDFFSKCDYIHRKQRIWSHLLKKSIMENFIFWAVWWQSPKGALVLNHQEIIIRFNEILAQIRRNHKKKKHCISFSTTPLWSHS